jgi:hypothetical protein
LGRKAKEGIVNAFFTARFAQGAEDAKGKFFAGMERKRTFRQTRNPAGSDSTLREAPVDKKTDDLRCICSRPMNGIWKRLLFLMAGIMTLASVILTLVHSSYWLILTTLVGLNQLILAFTGFCPSAIVFRGLGVKAKLEKASQAQ